MAAHHPVIRRVIERGSRAARQPTRPGRPAPGPRRPRSVRRYSPPDVEVRPPYGVLGPACCTLRLACDELVEVLLYECLVGESPIQNGLTEPADRRLTATVHRQASSNALAATLAGHTHVDQSSGLTLPREVHAGETGCRIDRVFEWQPRRPTRQGGNYVFGQH